MWELAHRTATADEATKVLIDADTSAAAIEQLRSEIPTDHLILYIRLTDRQAPVTV
jgi:hypothetical protein